MLLLLCHFKKITPELLQRYVELEQSAQKWEARGFAKTVKLKREQLKDLGKAMDSLKKKAADAKTQT